MNLVGSIRFAVPGAYFPFCAATSVIRFFFFQAEDGIRDLTVTGVQTCALPISWAPIFQKIAGAVSDIGGSMSHAAIVAREFGLPAVVGTGTATSRIKDGQRIRVDGGRGVVTLLS